MNQPAYGRSTALSAKQLLLIAFLIFLPFTTTSFANDTELAVAKVHEGFLSAGKSQSFAVSLNAGDFAQINFDPRGKELVVIAYDPSGSKFRGATLGPDADKFNFVADRPGTYRLEIAASDKTIGGAFTITLEKVVTLTARLAPPKPLHESPRIKALRASLEAGKKESVDAFWDEVKKQGAPILEPLPDDNKNMLVTFLWKGTPYTQNVIVLRLPYAGATPDDYLMQHLGETDVWYATVAIDRKSRFEYTLAPNVPRFQGLAYGIDGDTITMIAAAAWPDPLNPKRWRVDTRIVDAPDFTSRSIVEMPDAPQQPWLAERLGVPAGQVERHQFKSALLKNEREIAVYLPPGYSRTAKPYPLLVLFDEIVYLGDKNQTALVPTPTILNDLISEKRIPPMVALLVGNAPDDARSRELPCNPVFADFLSSELLPWAHGLYNFSADPRQAVVGGSSFGGLAAAYAGLRHSETFGNILSQSGSFHWIPPKSDTSSDSQSDSEPNWVAKQFIASPKLPLRFYLDAGSDEIDFTGNGNTILPATRNLRDVLLAKGYDVHFQEFAGGHDYLSWRGTLADGLILLMGNAPTKPVQEPPAKPD
jgi:enterochelin esterase-like enzyme